MSRGGRCRTFWARLSSPVRAGGFPVDTDAPPQPTTPTARTTAKWMNRITTQMWIPRWAVATRTAAMLVDARRLFGTDGNGPAASARPRRVRHSGLDTAPHRGGNVPDRFLTERRSDSEERNGARRIKLRVGRRPMASHNLLVFS